MALHLSVYKDRDIQKMRRLRGETFKECIQEGLSIFYKGTSTSMSHTLKYVNIEGSFPREITESIPSLDQDIVDPV